MPPLNQEDWLQIFTGDILACKTEAGLRRWATNWGDDINAKCPKHVKELRERYKQRLDELRGGNG